MFGLPSLPRTLAAALRDAEHAQSHVRLSALKDLVRLAHSNDGERERITLALIGLLRSDPHAELRAEAALALADIEGLGGRAALVAALEDPMLRVRQYALLALGELGEPGDEALGERLLELVDASDAALRFQALIACERLLPERAPSLLETALGDADAEVRAMALRLARSRWPDAGGPEGLVEKARALLGDHAPAVRGAAALWLGGRGEAAADGVLVGIIDGRVPLPLAADVAEAMELVAERELAAAGPALARRAFGLSFRIDPVRWHALVALARLGDPRARQKIVRGLSAWTRDARTLAVVAAGRAGLRDARERIRAFTGDPAQAEPEAVEEALRALDAPGD